MKKYSFIEFPHRRRSPQEIHESAMEFYKLMQRRRSIRHFSSEPVPRELIEIAVRTAATAPSGAHHQPWKFVCVSNSETKTAIRRAAEAEEKQNYDSRMPDDWLAALVPLGTTWEKPFLEEAPWLVVVFAESYQILEDGSKRKNYYVQESVGIACGLFITAIHQMGLCTLTHTPSPMAFLSEILQRPRNERAYILFPVGYPAEGCLVPDLKRKRLSEVSEWRE